MKLTATEYAAARNQLVAAFADYECCKGLSMKRGDTWRKRAAAALRKVRRARRALALAA